MQLFDVRNKIEKYTYQIHISFNNLHENIDSKIALNKTEAFVSKTKKSIKIGDFCKFNRIIFFRSANIFFLFNGLKSGNFKHAYVNVKTNNIHRR